MGAIRVVYHARISPSSSDLLYLMDLPQDVLSSIPLIEVENPPFGEAPMDAAGVIIGAITSTVVGVGEFLYNGLVATVTFMVELGTALVEVGLKIIDELVSSAAAAIVEAAEAIVDAFTAFVDWVVEFICDTFSALIVEPLQALYNCLEAWTMGLISLINSAANDIGDGADNASASMAIFSYIVDSDIFQALIVIGISLIAVITIASFLVPGGFIGPMVAPLIIDLIIAGMAAAVFSIIDTPNIVSWIAGEIWDILGIDIVGGMASIMGATIGTISWLAALMYAPVIGDAMGFALSSLGALLAWMGTMVSDWFWPLILDCFGFGLALLGVYEIFFNDESIIQDLNPTAKSIMKGVVVIEAGISLFELSTTVASYE